MRYVSQNCVFLSSAIIVIGVLVLQSTSSLSHALWKDENENIKEAVFLSPGFDLSPGSVVDRYYLDIEFPRGHIALKGLTAELVDEQGNSILLYETYLHHWVFDRYYQRKGTFTNYNGTYLPSDPNFILVRNNGVCQSNIYAQTFGFGSETRHTAYDIPNPYGIQVGDSLLVPDGFEEKWMLDVHAIDTRGVESTKGCIECWCDLYNVTIDKFGRPLNPDYIGGYLCCYDHTQCKLKEGFEGPTRRLFLKYIVKWVDWSDLVVPLNVYIFDITDRVEVLKRSRANSIEHNCQVEFDVRPCNDSSSECVDVRRTKIPMEKGGYIIYAVGHQHAGGVGTALYGQDGRLLCRSLPMYGNGTEVGNEEGYIVGMATCYPEPGSVKFFDGEILTHECNYSITQWHTGLMGLFYFYVAEHLPHHQHYSSNHYFSRTSSLLQHIIDK